MPLAEDERGDLLRGFFPDARHHVRVGVERDGDARVAEAFADDLGMDACLQREGCMPVAQVVESDARQPSSPHVPVEPPGEEVWVNRPAILAAEH
jgi:hypothetical protein